MLFWNVLVLFIIGGSDCSICTETGQPDLAVMQLASCFPSPLGEPCPRVKFRGLGKAAGCRSPGSSPRIEHRVAKNSPAFRAAQCSVPTTLQAGKGRRSPGLPADGRASVGVQPSVIPLSDCLKGRSAAHSAAVCVLTSRSSQACLNYLAKS